MALTSENTPDDAPRRTWICETCGRAWWAPVWPPILDIRITYQPPDGVGAAQDGERSKPQLGVGAERSPSTPEHRNVHDPHTSRE